MDNEVKGSGAQYDYGFRIYDPRLGRFLSVDPLFKSFPFYTSYQFAGNQPLIAVDLDGLEKYVVINYFSTSGRLEKTNIVTLYDKDNQELVDMQFRTLNKDGSLGELVAKGKEVLVRNVYSQNENKIVSPDEPKKSLNKRELSVYKSKNKVKDLGKENPFSVRIAEGKDMESTRDDFTEEQFAINERTNLYKASDATFKGEVLQSNKTFKIGAFGVYPNKVESNEIDIKDATTLANALLNTNIKAITMQPYYQSTEPNRIMENGQTIQQNVDANYRAVASLIEKLSGVKVKVLPAKASTTDLPEKSLEIKTN